MATHTTRYPRVQQSYSKAQPVFGQSTDNWTHLKKTYQSRNASSLHTNVTQLPQKKRTFAAVHGNIKSRRRPVLAAVHLSFIAMTYIANTQNGSSATISLCTDDKYVTFHSGSVKQAINKLNSVIKKLETGRPMTNISKCSITLFS